MTIFAQKSNNCRSKFVETTAPFVSLVMHLMETSYVVISLNGAVFGRMEIFQSQGCQVVMSKKAT